LRTSPLLPKEAIAATSSDAFATGRSVKSSNCKTVLLLTEQLFLFRVA
jgi:hypothetical protein